MKNKIQHGQFYTKGNCFQHTAFKEWYSSIPNQESLKIVEPFAGANNVLKLIDEANLGIDPSQWTSYDVEPEAIHGNSAPAVTVIQKDTLHEFPEGFDVCITNPPYLAKNSAKRKGMDIEFGKHQDLFEISLEAMLAKTPYVAAIIPESFISRQSFTERLVFVISLNYTMFEDTVFPVCLAVFNPEPTDDFTIYVGDSNVGTHKGIIAKSQALFESGDSLKLKFNTPHGQLGLRGIDGHTTAGIRFLEGDLIPSSTVSNKSRHITRIDIGKELSGDELNLLIEESNSLLKLYREATQDVFMTSFKGLRKDSRYRRRLDYTTAAKIVRSSMFKLGFS